MNKEGVKHAREANIIDRFEIKGTGNSFITLKDHKKNFQNCPTTRSLNYLKMKSTEQTIQNINITLSEKLKVNEQKITESIINW